MSPYWILPLKIHPADHLMYVHSYVDTYYHNEPFENRDNLALNFQVDTLFLSTHPDTVQTPVSRYNEG